MTRRSLKLSSILAALFLALPLQAQVGKGPNDHDHSGSGKGGSTLSPKRLTIPAGSTFTVSGLMSLTAEKSGLGIGTSAPQTVFHISTAAPSTGGSAAIRMDVSGGGSFQLTQGASNHALIPSGWGLLDVDSGVYGIKFTSRNAVEIRGEVNALEATAGYVGEVMSAQSNGAILNGSGVYVAIATVTLTAGDWEISGTGYVGAGATTAMTAITLGIGPGNTGSGILGNCFHYDARSYAVNGIWISNVGPCRVNVSASTPYYLVCRLTYTTAGGVTCGDTTYTFLRARRVR